MIHQHKTREGKLQITLCDSESANNGVISRNHRAFTQQSCDYLEPSLQQELFFLLYIVLRRYIYILIITLSTGGIIHKSFPKKHGILKDIICYDIIQNFKRLSYDIIWNLKRPFYCHNRFWFQFLVKYFLYVGVYSCCIYYHLRSLSVSLPVVYLC